MSKYDPHFYSTYQSASFSSATHFVRLLNPILKPKSVVDVGCGIGTWLKAWRTAGIEDIQGIDGNYVDRTQLQIPVEKFSPCDLANPPKTWTRKFDLAVSMEVGEHLPDTSSEAFVRLLCSLSDVVLFSAAVPYQGGTHHINEQWPEFWAEHFDRMGFVPVDFVRTKLWDNREVEYYYAQNALIFVRKERINDWPELRDAGAWTNPKCLARIHPRKWIHSNESPLPMKRLLTTIPSSTISFLRRGTSKFLRICGMGKSAQ